MKIPDPGYESPMQSRREQGSFIQSPRKTVRPSLHAQWSEDGGRQLCCMDDLDAVSVVLGVHSLSLSCVISKCPRLSTYRKEEFNLTHCLGNSSPGLTDCVHGPIARPRTI